MAAPLPAGAHPVLRLEGDSPAVAGAPADDLDGLPLGWVHYPGRGRVLGTVLGGDPAAWRNEPFLQLLSGAVDWACVGVRPGECPAGGYPLFEGTHAGRWSHRGGLGPRWTVADGELEIEPGTGDMLSRRRFGDVWLHLEFLLPAGAPGSALFLQDRHELRLVDSAGEPPSLESCGALAGRRAPDLNPCRPAGEWQTLDVWLEGRRLTAALNGVLLHEDHELPGHPAGEPAPVRLVDGGGRVRFRNLWALPWGRSAVGHGAPYDPRSEVAGFTDAELQAELRTALAGETHRRYWVGTFEAVLSEAIHRGGPDWEGFLREALALARAEEDGYRRADLELLTALRRVQGRRDPLRVVLLNPAPLEATFPELPALSVALENADEEDEVFTLSRGGDYRSGRQARWRLAVHDEGGAPVPGLPGLMGPGGGLHSRGPFEPGERWTTELRTGRFVELPRPGRYGVQVLYHDQLAIADEADVAGRIVSGSEPFTLYWKPRAIELPAADRERARALIAALDPEEAVWLTETPFGAWDGGAGESTSPSEALYRMGYRALPPLFEALEEPDLEPGRRAWVLALLYSISGLRDPRRERGILGDYTFRMAPIGSPATGEGLTSGSIRSQGEIDVGRQEAFAATWLPLRELLEVREVP